MALLGITFGFRLLWNRNVLGHMIYLKVVILILR